MQYNFKHLVAFFACFIHTVWSQPACSAIDNSDRLDCHPEYSATESACLNRGCCWSPPNNVNNPKVNEPYCYYPANFLNYQVVDSSRLSDKDSDGYVYSLQKNASTFRPAEILKLEAKIIFETDKRLRGRSHCIQ